MMKLQGALVAASITLVASSVAIGQTAVQYNRTIRNVAITPDASAPDRSNITVVFTVEATSPPVAPPEGALLDNVGTTVVVMVNGVMVGAVPFDIKIDPTTLGGPCGGTCGSGITNGMSAAMFCIDGICQMPPISAGVPAPRPGASDVISVLLMPGPGALPETNPAGDQRTIVSDGSPMGWNRRVASVQVIPSAPAAEDAAVGSFFDVVFEIEYSTFGMLEPASLGAEFVLIINGQATPFPASGCNDWIASPFDICEGCTLFHCGNASCGGQNMQLFCRVLENDNNLSYCGCVGEQTYNFPSVPLSPGDEVLVLLRPSPGALPELPGFDDDDNGAPPAGCEACPGDLNGDGIVDGTDLATLLINWGVCFPT